MYFFFIKTWIYLWNTEVWVWFECWILVQLAHFTISIIFITRKTNFLRIMIQELETIRKYKDSNVDILIIIFDQVLLTNLGFLAALINIWIWSILIGNSYRAHPPGFSINIVDGNSFNFSWSVRLIFWSFTKKICDKQIADYFKVSEQHFSFTILEFNF